MANGSDEQWLIWCDRNAESAELKALIPDAVEVKGADSNQHKEQSMLGFQARNIRVLRTKLIRTEQEMAERRQQMQAEAVAAQAAGKAIDVVGNVAEQQATQQQQQGE